MDKKETSIIVSILFLIAVPLLTTFALDSADDRYPKEEEIRIALEKVEEQRSQYSWLEKARNMSEEKIDDLKNNVQSLTREKRVIRLRLAELIRLQDEMLSMGIDPQQPEEVLSLLLEEKDGMANLVRSAYNANRTGAFYFVSALVASRSNVSLGERTEESLKYKTLKKTRQHLLNLLRAAPKLPSKITDVRSEHENLLSTYWVALREAEQAEYYLHAAAPLQDQISATVAEVEGQISKMQSELARIDARLRRRAERALIEKGLRSTREGAYTSGKIVGDPEALSWPAKGPISAGFYDSGYKKIFGFDHKGIDIAVPQGSNVHSAADGVVYLARDGGATGYSYILIGHRGGTATLYGHMSKIHVRSGQEVSRGTIIGLSGGTPGTYGAGPITTGAHLHLEVLQNGKHIDPAAVLP
ncbi:MAG: peptidoglycan DD-metalloendopeptidase family protein [Candidatus Peribacteraceae bacterium]|nr:peptidoglycan DD-metalloendopeptidase family protein [Candidatus Peribacteraceae bacterium]